MPGLMQVVDSVSVDFDAGDDCVRFVADAGTGLALLIAAELRAEVAACSCATLPAAVLL
jgi:hypothetical protein